MATYYSFYCPHCKRFIGSSTNPYSRGCPIKHCPKCQKLYIDAFCTEPALKEFRPYSLRNLFLGNRLYVLFFSMFVALAAKYIFRPAISDLLLWLICIPTTWLLLVLFCWLNRKTITKNRSQRWQESDKRLRDPDYASVLKRFGYHVPARYVPSDFRYNAEPPLPGVIVVRAGKVGKEQCTQPEQPGGSEYY